MTKQSACGVPGHGVWFPLVRSHRDITPGPRAEVVSRSFPITPVLHQSDKFKPDASPRREDDINKLGRMSEYKASEWLGGVGGVQGGGGEWKYFFTPLNGAVNDHFSAERRSREADGGSVVGGRGEASLP